MSKRGKDDIWELRLQKMPKGAHRSRSRGTPGTDRDLLRDGSNKLLGPTESRPVDMDKLREELLDTSEDNVSYHSDTPEQGPDWVAIVEGALELAQVVMSSKVFQEKVVPVVRRGAQSVRQRLSGKPAKTGSQNAIMAAEAAAVTARPENDLSVAAPAIRMSADEYRARLLAALRAENFAAEQKRLLAIATVDDLMPSPELAEAIQLALTSDFSSLGDDTLRQLQQFLGQRVATTPAERTPSQMLRERRAPRLTRGLRSHESADQADGSAINEHDHQVV